MAELVLWSPLTMARVIISTETFESGLARARDRRRNRHTMTAAMSRKTITIPIMMPAFAPAESEVPLPDLWPSVSETWTSKRAILTRNHSGDEQQAPCWRWADGGWQSGWHARQTNAQKRGSNAVLCCAVFCRLCMNLRMTR